AGWIENPRLSPDGSRVAFLDHPERTDASGTVRVAGQGGEPVALGRAWSDVSGVAWSRDGGEVWFTAAEGGATRALRAVSLRGALRVLLRTPGSLELQDVSGDGRVLATHWHGRV